MKKLLCLLLSIICAFGITASLTACGGESGGTEGLKYTKQEDGTYFVSGIETKTETIVIPSSYNGKSVTGVAEDAFLSDRTVKSVTLPSSVYVIEESAFYNCASLEKVNLEKVAVIKDSAFRNTKLASVKFDSLQTVGKNAFYGCSLLKTVSFPSGVSEIGQSAFSGCTLLNTVIFNGNVTTVGKNAFSGCSLLRNVNVEKVKYFKEGCFQSCVSLESINLENAVSVETAAFSGCNKLKTVTLGANLIYIHKDAMKGDDTVTSVEVVDKEGWYNVGTCARCAVTEWAGLKDASFFNDPVANVSTFVASDWTHNAYLCKQQWVDANRPNGWNVNNNGIVCTGCNKG